MRYLIALLVLLLSGCVIPPTVEPEPTVVVVTQQPTSTVVVPTAVPSVVPTILPTPTPVSPFPEPYERCGEFGVDVREAKFLAQSTTIRNVRSGPSVTYAVVEQMLPEEVYLVMKHEYVDDNTRWSCVYNIEEVEVVGWVADIYNGEVVVNIYGSK